MSFAVSLHRIVAIRLAQAITRLTYIFELLGSNLGGCTTYPEVRRGLSQAVQVNAADVPYC
jgi:hypothetical protein